MKKGIEKWVSKYHPDKLTGVSEDIKTRSGKISTVKELMVVNNEKKKVRVLGLQPAL